MYYLKDEHGQQRNVEAVTTGKDGLKTVYFYNSMMSSVSIKEIDGVFIYRGSAWTLEETE